MNLLPLVLPVLGKTTTLHAACTTLTAGQKNMDAEDPVEITQYGLRQVQVHSKIGFDFAAAMRAFLRADPDVIMVGEMPIIIKLPKQALRHP